MEETRREEKTVQSDSYGSQPQRRSEMESPELKNNEVKLGEVRELDNLNLQL